LRTASAASATSNEPTPIIPDDQQVSQTVVDMVYAITMMDTWQLFLQKNFLMVDMIMIQMQSL
jgi:hypothetical protein